jgi:hypothetical protein
VAPEIPVYSRLKWDIRIFRELNGRNEVEVVEG